MRNVVSLQGLLLCPFVFQPFYTQVFHKTLPSGKEANLPVVTTVSYEQRCLACFYTPKKNNRKHGTQPGLHRSAKSCSLTHFCEFHMKFRGGTFKNSTKLYPSNTYGYLGLHISSYGSNSTPNLHVFDGRRSTRWSISEFRPGTWGDLAAVAVNPPKPCWHSSPRLVDQHG